jgi:hypothetical protein
VSERPSPMTHLTPEQLDELATRASADLDPDQARLVDDLPDGHLAGCTACREALGDQIAVRRLLQGVPATGPLPADIATRLDAALHAAQPGTAEPATVLPMVRRAERSGVLGRLAESRLTKGLVAAAAVGLIALGGYAAIGRSDSGSGGAASTASGKAAGGSKALTPEEKPNLASVPIEASGTAYTKANITAVLTKRLARSSGEDASGFTAGVAESTSLTTPAGLRACLGALGVTSGAPVLVDLATYEGKPAAVIVVPSPSGVGRQVWVVSRTCAGTQDGLAYYGALN